MACTALSDSAVVAIDEILVVSQLYATEVLVLGLAAMYVAQSNSVDSRVMCCIFVLRRYMILHTTHTTTLKFSDS